MLMDCLDSDIDLWQTEKRESERALEILKRESISHIVAERDKVLAMSHEEALAELVRVKRFDMRMDYIRRVRHGTLLEHL